MVTHCIRHAVIAHVFRRDSRARHGDGGRIESESAGSTSDGEPVEPLGNCARPIQ